MGGIGVIDKVSLISKKDNFIQLKKELEKDGFSIDLFFENSLSSISFVTENPDPIEISIKYIDESYYRVSYWDGYGVTEFYDYPQLNKAEKKFFKFITKAKSNIEKFGIK